MKIVVAGGAGRAGTRIVQVLVDRGNYVVAAAPRHGVDAITGHGLVAAADLARVVADVAGGKPVGGSVEMAGPERMSSKQFAERRRRTSDDPCPVVADAEAQYLGTRFAPGDTSLLPTLQLAPTSLDSWMSAQRATATT